MTEPGSPPKTYWLETYGCQMNKAESGFLEYELHKRGWRSAACPDQARVVVLNTCSVRKTAEDRIWGRLGFYKAEKRRHPFRLVFMGCMSERLKGQILEQAPHIDILVGNFQKHRLPELLEEDICNSAQDMPERGGPHQEVHLIEAGEYRFAERHALSGFRAFLPIMHGCNNFCTYCIVPYVRGPEVSRDPDSILAEMRKLQQAEGVREITLLGQNVNSYRYREDGGRIVTFPTLLHRVLAVLQPRTWLRFLTSHPKDVSPELIELIAAAPALCRHIHLPVQHGSDRILAAMGRKYTRSQYLDLVERIRNFIPEVSLTTDILIGFPGESKEDYRRTLELMEEVRFDDAFTYRYNPREGTRAFELGDDVPDEVKKKRLGEVIELQRNITRERRSRRVGDTVDVLVESVSKKSPKELLGRTESDLMVVFPGSIERVGSFCRVELLRLQGATFRGREVE